LTAIPPEKAAGIDVEFTLNGKPRALEAPTDITRLLAELNVKPEQVAVAVNGEVVRRTEWASTEVREGDVIELVRAVGGG
jgi:sulfur carrier protein